MATYQPSCSTMEKAFMAGVLVMFVYALFFTGAPSETLVTTPKPLIIDCAHFVGPLPADLEQGCSKARHAQ